MGNSTPHPLSLTPLQGVISATTLHLVAKLRSKHVKFVVISGARLGTLMMRLPYLPAADAFVCENGGRVFYPGGPLPTACPITEDADWRTIQEPVAGPASQDGIPPESRTGLLWTWYRTLKEEGWALDANGYTTNFRAHGNKNGKSLGDLEAVIKRAPEGVSCSWNLGAADFYPATSGKVMAAR